jgi:hypothetical protein
VQLETTENVITDRPRRVQKNVGRIVRFVGLIIDLLFEKSGRYNIASLLFGRKVFAPRFFCAVFVAPHKGLAKIILFNSRRILLHEFLVSSPEFFNSLQSGQQREKTVPDSQRP